MGLGRFELPTPRLSSVCSNQAELQARLTPRALDHLAPVLSKLDRTTRTLATPDLTSGDTTSGQCPDIAKNQIDLSSRELPGPSLSKTLSKTPNSWSL